MRKNGKQFPIIKPFRPIFFWKECRFCGGWFIREKGFKIEDIKLVRFVGENPTYTSYCCNYCAKHEFQVKAKLIKQKKLSNVPKVR